MKRNFKIVKPDKINSDEYLVGFFETEMQAQSALFEMPKKYPTWIKSRRELLVKRVDPELIPSTVATDYSHYCRSLIPDEEWNRVMQSDAAAEIDSNNMMCGFGGRTYYNLSKMIPKDWTVIDFGCAYNPQSYLFKDHARHIAIEPAWKDSDFHFEYFKAPNTELMFMTGQEFIEDELQKMDLVMNKTFAICNYVYSGACNLMVRETFANVFTFYPA